MGDCSASLRWRSPWVILWKSAVSVQRADWPLDGGAKLRCRWAANRETAPPTILVDVLQRVGEHPASRATELTPRMWKTMFANDPPRTDLDRARDPPSG